MRRFHSSIEEPHVLSSGAGSPHQSMCSMADKRDLLPSWDGASLSFNHATDCFQQHLHKRDVVSIETPPLSISRLSWFSLLFHSHPFFYIFNVNSTFLPLLIFLFLLTSSVPIIESGSHVIRTRCFVYGRSHFQFRSRDYLYWHIFCAVP
jgi:hypothetical protein